MPPSPCSWWPIRSGTECGSKRGFDLNRTEPRETLDNELEIHRDACTRKINRHEALAHPSKRSLQHLRGYFLLLSLASLLLDFLSLSVLLLFFDSLLDFEVFLSDFFDVSAFLLDFSLDLEDVPDLARQ